MLQFWDHNIGEKLMTKGELKHLLLQNQKLFPSHISNIHIKELVSGFIWPGYWNSLWSTKPHSIPKDKTSDFFIHEHSNHYILTCRKLTPGHQTKNPGSLWSSVLWKKMISLVGWQQKREWPSSVFLYVYTTQVPPSSQ